MVYIQLSESIKGYNRVRIKQINYFDNTDTSVDKSINFKYMVYRKDGNTEKVLYDKFISVLDRGFVEETFEKKNSKNLSAFDSLCRILLNYLIENAIETGTLEVE